MLLPLAVAVAVLLGMAVVVRVETPKLEAEMVL
jgi:hypothetical protein